MNLPEAKIVNSYGVSDSPEQIAMTSEAVALYFELNDQLTTPHSDIEVACGILDWMYDPNGSFYVDETMAHVRLLLGLSS